MPERVYKGASHCLALKIYSTWDDTECSTHTRTRPSLKTRHARGYDATTRGSLYDNPSLAKTASTISALRCTTIILLEESALVSKELAITWLAFVVK